MSELSDDADGPALLGSLGSLDSIAFTSGATGVVTSAAPRPSDAPLLRNRRRRLEPADASAMMNAPPSPFHAAPAAATNSAVPVPASAAADANDDDDHDDDDAGDDDEQEAARHMLLADDCNDARLPVAGDEAVAGSSSDDDGDDGTSRSTRRRARDADDAAAPDDRLVEAAIAFATQRPAGAPTAVPALPTMSRRASTVELFRTTPRDGGASATAMAAAAADAEPVNTPAAALSMGTQRVARVLRMLDEDEGDDDDDGADPEGASAVLARLRRHATPPAIGAGPSQRALPTTTSSHAPRDAAASAVTANQPQASRTHESATPSTTSGNRTAPDSGANRTTSREERNATATVSASPSVVDARAGVGSRGSSSSLPPLPSRPSVGPRAPHPTLATPTPALRLLHATVTHPNFASTIADCGLPEAICAAYAARGVTSLFPWQTRCLRDYYESATAAAASTPPSSMTLSDNLLYMAPTSGGKTLVAEVMMLRAILGLDHVSTADVGDANGPQLNRYHHHYNQRQPRPRKVFFVVPYVAIAEEKAAYFTAITGSGSGGGGGDLRVICHAGSRGQRMLSAELHVCTMEKANVLLSMLLEQGRSDELGLVAIDELHQLSEPGRGHVLELLITKLLDLRARQQARFAETGVSPVRIVGMSATLTSAPRLARWLDHAYLFVTDYRPVPLREHYVVNGAVFDALSTKLRTLPVLQPQKQQREEKTRFEKLVHTVLKKLLAPAARLGPDGALLSLVAECLRDGVQCLVFCPTRDSCAASCKLISEFLTFEVPVTDVDGGAGAGPAIVAPPPAKRPPRAESAAALLARKTSGGGAPPPPPETALDDEAGGTPAEADDQPPPPEMLTVERLALELCRTVYHGGDLAATAADAPATRRTALASILGAGGQPHQDEKRGEAGRASVGPATTAELLARTLPVGVALHSAALTSSERGAVEAAFRSGGVWALCCTTTLAAGVNLPARRVIFRSPRVAHIALDATHYRQAAGRAGRTGLVGGGGEQKSFGESFLIGTDSERAVVKALVVAALPPIRSNFAPERRGCARLLLEGFTSGAIADAPSVHRFLGRTLFAATADSPATVRSACVDALRYLEYYGFVRWVPAKQQRDSDDSGGGTEDDGDDDARTLKVEHGNDNDAKVGDGDGRFVVTKLGAATVAASLSPEEALALQYELRRAKERFVLGEELHIVFLCAPFSSSAGGGGGGGSAGLEPKWPLFADLFATLPASCRAVAEAAGVSEPWVRQAATCPPLKWAAVAPRGVPPPLPPGYDYETIATGPKPPPELEQEIKQAVFARFLFAHRRFYAALVLRDIVRETALPMVARKFGVQVAELHRLMESACAAAATASAFADRLGWWFFPPLLEKLSPRLQRGVAPELVQLARLPGLSAWRARGLYRRGFRDPAAVAVASAEDIAAALAKSRRGAMVVGDGGNDDGDDGGEAGNGHSTAKKKKNSDDEQHRSMFHLAEALIAQAKAVLREDAAAIAENTADIAAALGGAAALSPTDALRRVLGQQPTASLARPPAVAKTPPRRSKQPASAGATTPRLPQRTVLFRSGSRPNDATAAAAAAAAVAEVGSVRQRDEPNSKGDGMPAPPSPPPPRRKEARPHVPKPTTTNGAQPCGGGHASSSAWLSMQELVTAPDVFVARDVDETIFAASQAAEWIAAVRREFLTTTTVVAASDAETVPSVSSSSSSSVPTAGVTVAVSLEARQPRGTSSAPPTFTVVVLGLRRAATSSADAVTATAFTLMEYAPVAPSPAAEGSAPPVAVDDVVVAFVLGELLCRRPDVTLVAYAAQQQLRRFCEAVVAADAWRFRKNGHAGSAAAAEAASLGALQRAMAAMAGFVDPLVADWAASPDDRAGGRSTSLRAMCDAFRRSVEAVVATPPTADVNDATPLPAHLAACSFVERSGGRGGAPLAMSASLLVTARYLVRRLSQLGTGVETLLAIEAPTVPVLAWLELVGVPFDRRRMGSLRTAMAERAEGLVADARAETRRSDWSLTSPQQCAKMLFDVLQLPSLEDTDHAKQLGHIRAAKVRRSGLRETRSTRQTVLLQLQRLYPGVALPFIVQEHRTLVGWDEKFIAPLLAAARPSSFGFAANAPTRVYGAYLHTATATGRLAMGEPNLQTIPHPVCFRVGPSAPLVPLRLRDAFAPPPKSDDGGCYFDTILVADFAQIEARLLAHFSRDPALVAAFSGDDSGNGNGRSDVFVRLAADVFGVPPVLLPPPDAAEGQGSATVAGDHAPEVDGVPNISARVAPPALDAISKGRHDENAAAGVTPAQRKHCKMLCYGMLYGRGAGSIAEELGVNVADAQALLDRFRATYATATRFLRAAGEQAVRDGYVASITGRRRPVVASARAAGGGGNDARGAKAALERMAVNTLCQGSAADLVKLAMVRLVRELAAIPASDGVSGVPPPARLVHQVHDELVLEVRSDRLEAVAAATRRAMTGVAGAFRLSVPFPVKLQAGPSWGQLRPLPPSAEP